MNQSLKDKLLKRENEGTLRSLSSFEGMIDFHSNDYLGASKLKLDSTDQQFGGTGSRLISGTSASILEAEMRMAEFFGSQRSLMFNSGYDANLGVFSSIPQKGDTVIYDEYIHASVRDGIRMSLARSFSFKHNDCDDLRKKLNQASGNCYVAVESLYSMHGDIAPLTAIATICQEVGANMIVDEAHAGGIYGENGKGIISALGLENQVFLRLITFGKAYGSHGGLVLADNTVIDYLVNFARSFIYTTALPEYVYQRNNMLLGQTELLQNREELFNVLNDFQKVLQANGIHSISEINSPIQFIRIANKTVLKTVAENLHQKNFAVKAVFAPTVPEGQEGLRICLHSFNSKKEIEALFSLLKV